MIAHSASVSPTPLTSSCIRLFVRQGGLGTSGRGSKIGLRRQSSFTLFRNEHGSEPTSALDKWPLTSRHPFGPRLRQCKKATSKWQRKGMSPELPARFQPGNDTRCVSSPELGTGTIWEPDLAVSRIRLDRRNDYQPCTMMSNPPEPSVPPRRPRRSRPPVTKKIRIIATAPKISRPIPNTISQGTERCGHLPCSRLPPANTRSERVYQHTVYNNHIIPYF